MSTVTMKSYVVGRVLKAPLDVSSTGLVRIVGVNSVRTSHSQWDYVCVEHDPLQPNAPSKGNFRVQGFELEKWNDS